MTRKPYPSDIADAEWEIISALVPEAKPIGRPRQVDLREIILAIFYVLHEGCTWRAQSTIYRRGNGSRCKDKGEASCMAGYVYTPRVKIKSRGR